jgi:AraC-like DNA-binding protein
MMEQHVQTVQGPVYQRIFSNGSPDPAGSVISAGIGTPFRPLTWWEEAPLKGQPYYGLIMMLGTGTGYYRDESGFQCELAQGYFFFTFPHLKLACGPLKGQKYGELYVGFGGDLFDHAYEKQLLCPKQPVWKLDEPESWIERLRSLIRPPTSLMPQREFRHAIHFLHFLLEMQEAAQPVNVNNNVGDWFDIARHAITSDLHHKIDWNALAGSLGMSYHTFRLKFRTRAGMPPYQYREKYRFETACELLRSAPIHSCRDVAFVLGYSNPDHFTEQFKKRFGISPLEYRKRHCA